jgi:hypothetical protein
MNHTAPTVICTPSRIVLTLRDSTYRQVCLRRSLLRATRSDAHLTLSRRALMNNPGYITFMRNEQENFLNIESEFMREFGGWRWGVYCRGGR